MATHNFHLIDVYSKWSYSLLLFSDWRKKTYHTQRAPTKRIKLTTSEYIGEFNTNACVCVRLRIRALIKLTTLHEVKIVEFNLFIGGICMVAHTHTFRYTCTNTHISIKMSKFLMDYVRFSWSINYIWLHSYKMKKTKTKFSSKKPTNQPKSYLFIYLDCCFYIAYVWLASEP